MLREGSKLEEAGMVLDQSQITDYFSVMNEIEHLLSENSRLASLLHCSTSNTGSENNSCTGLSTSSFTAVLQQIISNAEQNASRLPQGARHPEVVQKFATSLFIYTGPLAYEFLQQNLSQSLPSVRTVQRIIRKEYKVLCEEEFRFEDLTAHLTRYNVPHIVTIGEDATRVISRVEYDSETDRCVGFVLPVNQFGLADGDSFLAISFEAIERMFSAHEISKYAYVYMVQPLAAPVPSFCLACFSPNNKFTSEHVLLRWHYILKECQKRNIYVLSFGGDGDSHLLKGMRVSVGLNTTKEEAFCTNMNANPTLKQPKIPSSWTSWFIIEHPSSLSYAQDVVHIAVKLKSRLLKPSIILPMGCYVAGVHHLRTVQITFGKDIHGLREKDLNHKDKQNIDAVLIKYHQSSKCS